MCLSYCAHSKLYCLAILVAPEDYISDTGQLIFTTGDDRQCHRVRIVNNDICEDELEQFLSNLALVSGVPRITVDPASARVIIDDTDDCGKYCFCLRVSAFIFASNLIICLSHSSWSVCE